MTRLIHSITDLVTGTPEVGHVPLFVDGSGWSSVSSSVVDIRSYGVTDLSGETTYTNELQDAFDAADARGMPVSLPCGTILTGALNWKGQSIIGPGSGLCTLKGRPGEDVLHLDPTVTHYEHLNGKLQGFTIEVDDSVDASASFPQRGGKGNAGLAGDFANGAATYPMSLVGWVVDDLKFTGSGGVIGGRNKVCGIYNQHAMFPICQFGTISFEYLANGWWDHFPTSNLASNSNARDHIRIGTAYFAYCGNSWRMVNWSYARIDHLVMHETQGNALDFTASTDLSIGLVNDITFGTVMIENCDGAVFSCTGTVQTIRMEALITNGAANAPTWAGNDSQLNNWSLSVTGNPATVLTVSGHHNTIALRPRGDSTAIYQTDTVVDTGYGNTIEVIALTSTGSTINRKRANYGRDGRIAHARDAASAMLGHVSPLFRSGDDLLINPRTIIPSGSTEGVGHEYEADTDTQFGLALKILGSAGNWFCSDDGLLGLNSFRVGHFLPANKVRVYVRVKATTGGTQLWALKNSSAVTRGSATFTLTTSYATYSFDADLSSDAGDSLILGPNAMGGGGAAPIWIEWVAFRPWAVDSIVVMDQVSADNGDAAKTLVAGADFKVQRWATAITADRAATLSTTGARSGDTFHIVRTAAATGAFNLNVGTGPLKALAAGTWCDVHYNGSAWMLTAYGAL